MLYCVWSKTSTGSDLNKYLTLWTQVLAEEGKAKAIAFDEIDKAPEEKKRGITIATVRIYFLCFWNISLFCIPHVNYASCEWFQADYFGI